MVTVVLVGGVALPEVVTGPRGVFDLITITPVAPSAPMAIPSGVGATRTLRITTHPAIPITVAVFVP